MAGLRKGALGTAKVHFTLKDLTLQISHSKVIKVAAKHRGTVLPKNRGSNCAFSATASNYAD